MKYSFSCFITYCFFIMLPAETFATCYTVYDSSDKAVYKSPEPPFDMSISISDNIKSKYPGGYLLTTQSTSCSLPKAGDVSYESINSRLKNQDRTPGQRVVAIPSSGSQSSGDKCADLSDQLSNAPVANPTTMSFGEMGAANAKRNAITKEYELRCLSSGDRQSNQSSSSQNSGGKCADLLDQLSNAPVANPTTMSFGEMGAANAKRNAITKEYELRCLSSGDRQAAQEKRSNAQTQNQLRQIQQTQQQMKQQQDHDKIWGKKCKPDGFGNLQCY